MTTRPTTSKPATDDLAPDRFDALLIIGHGTRDPAGLAEFRSLVDQVARQRTDWHVRSCFLELAQPSIATAIDSLAAEGRWRVRAMPLVLFAGGHARRDIPNALSQAIARNPGFDVELCPPLGCHREIMELSRERCRLALVGRATVSPDETLLILAGRGGSDAEAIAQMQQLAELRRIGVPPGDFNRQSSRASVPGSRSADKRDPQATAANASDQYARIDVGFVAVATPSLRTVLEQASRTDFRRVIVQPHLLFAGNVLEEIRRLVEQQQLVETARKTSSREWIMTDVLGPDPRLVTTVVDIVSTVTPRPHGIRSELNGIALRYRGRA